MNAAVHSIGTSSTDSLSAEASRDRMTEQSRTNARGTMMVSAARQVRLLAVREFWDRFRSGWVVACVLVWVGAIGLTSFLGLLQMGRLGIQGYERTAISLLNLVQYLVPLLGLLLGHDLIVGEAEERTLRLLLATGLTRTRLLVGKWLGGCLATAFPLVLGFGLAGPLIGVATRDGAFQPFLRLAVSALALGFVFVGIGLVISVFCRTRVRALVVTLLTWCVAVFVFDLVALSIIVSTNVRSAAEEIELVCDATHVNSVVDVHAQFEDPAGRSPAGRSSTRETSVAWIAVNPVDLFRAINLPLQVPSGRQGFLALAVILGWIVAILGIGLWKLHRIDL